MYNFEKIIVDFIKVIILEKHMSKKFNDEVIHELKAELLDKIENWEQNIKEIEKDIK